MGKVRRAAFSPFFSPFPLLFVERSRLEVQSVFEIFSSALEREFFSFIFFFYSILRHGILENASWNSSRKEIYYSRE